MADIYLVCEGPPDGLDVRVLDAILARKLDAPVRIVPSGGDQSLAGVRTYLEARSRQRGLDGTYGPPLDVALAIEDRNHRPLSDADDRWHRQDKHLVWRRHEIENYLLEPRVTLAAFASLRRTVQARWAEALPQEESAVLETLAQIARAALAAHAARVLEWELYVKTTVGNPSDFRLRVRPGAEWRRERWLSALLDEAARLRQEAGACAGLQELEPTWIEARYEEILAGLQRPQFIAERAHLTDMKGKALFKALAAYVRVRRPVLEDEMVRVLPDVYEPGTLFSPDEFVRLRDRIASLAAR